jgi:repressor LexA
MKPTERKILDYVTTAINEWGFSPTLQEITDAIGYRSRGSVRHYVNALVEAGHLLRDEHRSRGLSLPEPDDARRYPAIPLAGRIAAGRPIEAIPENEHVDFHERLDEPGLYQLLVAGDSMIDAGIHDGDTVLIRPARSAPNGAIVVALIDGQEATLKRIYQRDGRITLKAENPDHPTRHYAPERVEVQGILHSVHRFF